MSDEQTPATPEQEEKLLFPASRVKEFAQTLNMRFASDALPQLDVVVKALITRASERATANGRGTIKPADL